MRIKKRTSKEFEIPAATAVLEDEYQTPIMLFENIVDSNLPVVTNLLSSRKNISLALYTEEKSLTHEIIKREKKVLPPLIDSVGLIDPSIIISE